jgi:hypothetical protein
MSSSVTENTYVLHLDASHQENLSPLLRVVGPAIATPLS